MDASLKNKTIITAAVTGAWPKKENNPNVPMTPQEIADDVYDYIVTPSKQIVYLCEYDVDDAEGELYLYKKNKPQKIDDEVSAIIYIYAWYEL